MPVVEVRDLSKTYRIARGRHVEALRGLTLRVEEGEVFGLLGQNGAGKSTLVRCLLSLCRPTSGQAFLFGEPASRPDLRQRVGYLPEDHRFPDYHTARSALVFFANLLGLGGAAARKRVDEVLQLVGLSDRAKEKVRNFSKGMRQRLALAHAILHRPKLLFLDEPTDGVDPVGRIWVRDLVLSLRTEGTTVFLNSHILSEVERICSRVLILHEGRAVQEGTIAALTSEASQYDLAVAGDPGRAMEVLGGRFRGLTRTDQGVVLTVDREEDVDRAVDLLRGASIGVRSLLRRRHTLEEIFLHAVTEARPPGGAA